MSRGHRAVGRRCTTRHHTRERVRDAALLHGPVPPPRGMAPRLLWQRLARGPPVGVGRHHGALRQARRVQVDHPALLRARSAPRPVDGLAVDADGFAVCVVENLHSTTSVPRAWRPLRVCARWAAESSHVRRVGRGGGGGGAVLDAVPAPQEENASADEASHAHTKDDANDEDGEGHDKLGEYHIDDPTIPPVCGVFRVPLLPFDHIRLLPRLLKGWLHRLELVSVVV
mmetsp:Transcript_1326/g.3204  ORF Transcript_1326/g.3204 Transcript_1326/m.3204 type:complete len:228 (-) Transcript_1326:804-1487(-)